MSRCWPLIGALNQSRQCWAPSRLSPAPVCACSLLRGALGAPDWPALSQSDRKAAATLAVGGGGGNGGSGCFFGARRPEGCRLDAVQAATAPYVPSWRQLAAKTANAVDPDCMHDDSSPSHRMRATRRTSRLTKYSLRFSTRRGGRRRRGYHHPVCVSASLSARAVRYANSLSPNRTPLHCT